jgi:galactofuranose transport system ATP-binding protein
MTEGSIILQMKGINKTFPGVKALTNMNFSLQAGEIHALMGENGAGKSTLIKVLTGVEQPDSGEIKLNGKVIQAKSPKHAQVLGISTVYQEVNLCPNMSVAENIFIGREKIRFGFIDAGDAKRKSKEILNRMDIHINVARTLDSYSVSIQQMVAIARALDVAAAKVLILDEPTSSLDVHETQKLFEVIRKLKSEGLGIIFITHFIDQMYEISDRVTILRQGELVGTYETASLSRLELVTKMIGKALDDLENISKTKEEVVKRTAAKPLLRTKKLGHKGFIEPFDLDVFSGEVLGFAGLLGSGRSEAASLLFGVDSPDSGTIEIDHKEYKRLTPLKAIMKGIGLCPEDRKADGIFNELTVRENIILALQSERGWFHFLPLKQQYEIANRYIRALRISTPSPDQLIKNLSGGNQQKVILARWLATNPRLLILDEPTRGIDIGTKAEIQKMILALAEEGKAIIFISSELEEVIRCSNRVMVLRDKHKAAELVGEHVNQAEIMQTIAGRSPNE